MKPERGVTIVCVLCALGGASTLAGEAIDMTAACKLWAPANSVTVQQNSSTACQLGHGAIGNSFLLGPFAGVANQTPTYTPQATPADYATLLVGTAVTAVGLFNSDNFLDYQFADVEAYTSISETLMTPGPVRPGILYVDTSAFDGPHGYGLPFLGRDSTFDIGPVSGYWIANTAGACNINHGACAAMNAIPFVLGQSFDADLSAQLGGWTGINLMSFSERAYLPLSFRLTEQDGVTPVAIQLAPYLLTSQEITTPEPSTFSTLLLAASIGLLGWRLLRQSRHA
jgi:hypothetical protein